MIAKMFLKGALSLALLGALPAVAADEAAKPAAPAAPAAEEGAKSAPPASDPALDAAVARLQKAYEGLTSLKAAVKQTSRLSTLAKEEVQSGHLVMAKPGRIRWTFTDPYERLFISDGKTLYIYNKDENQVIKQPLSGQAGGVGVDFLLGLGDVKKDFDVTLVKEAEYQKEGRDALSLKPKKPAGSISLLIFSVDQKTGLVQEAWTFDPMENRTHLDFSDLEVNPEVKDEIFQFTPPEGAEIIDAGGM